MNTSFNVGIEEVVLYQSVLTTRGAEYEPIYRFSLDAFASDYDEEFNNRASSFREYLVDEG